MSAGSAALAPAQVGMLGRGERLALGAQLTLALVAGCLLLVAVGLRLVAAGALSQLVAGGAASLVAVPVIAAAWHSLRHPDLHGITDRLIALALVAAWASGDLLTAALLPIIMILGHVLEERSLLGSREAIRALGRLTRATARRRRPDGSTEDVPAELLAPGDLVELRAGDRVPVDGVVREGSASLDMASLTGESVPIDVAAGERVLAGAVDTDGSLLVEAERVGRASTLGRIVALLREAERVGRASTLGRIVALLREAERAKPPVTRLLDRHAGHYTVLVLLLAAGTWFLTGNTAAMLAVLVASCPCALVLAAPATSVAAIAVAARHGILIKGAAFLERLADVDSVVFDKTGTLTTGQLTLVEARPGAGIAAEDLREAAASLGAASSHPVSRAAAALGAGTPLEQVRETGGLGVTGVRDGETLALGRPELFARLGLAVPDAPAHAGPICGVSAGEKFLGWLLFADQARAEAPAAVAALRALGMERQMLLTGDRAAVAREIAAKVGITDFCAGALPEEKMRRVQAEVAAGWSPLVVGDGINDTLALKVGAVGVAMGSGGIDVALASADLVLMTNDLRRLATCLRLSRRCRSTIHANVAIGLGWTVVLIVAAAAGWLGAEGAILAAVLHNASTAATMANSGRMLLFDET